ncbi:hypothetical protein [Mycobacterium sp. OTB74]|jgi:hypothetical protein|uniref:hypothetical protein n=1 Tax=Mycobacterium sp. OTB74 TaxID=1853452 RepID=UPI002474F14C|nr:hypothetical protein [Mycobacterium sp. OTB74]
MVVSTVSTAEAPADSGVVVVWAAEAGVVAAAEAVGAALATAAAGWATDTAAAGEAAGVAAGVSDAVCGTAAAEVAAADLTGAECCSRLGDFARSLVVGRLADEFFE